MGLKPGLMLALYTLLLVASSLHPFSGWKPLLDWSSEFITAPLPRYITRTDLSTNLLVYAPFGYLLALHFSRPQKRGRALLLALVCGLLLSFMLESLQQIIPGRIASNLDIFINTLGTATGALMSLHHRRWLRAMESWRRWRASWFDMRPWADAGIWLLLAWVLTQFSLLPFPGAGWLGLHLRTLDTPLSSVTSLNLPWLAASFLEMATIGAFMACLLKPGRYVASMVMLFLVAFLIKLFTATILLKLRVAGGVLSLETLLAFMLAFWFLLMPPISRHRQAIAITLLLIIILLRALTADYLFLPNVPLLNIVGIAKAFASLWPYLALGMCLWRAIHLENRMDGPVYR